MQQSILKSKVVISNNINLTIKIVLTSLLAATAIALRLFKHIIIGPIQIINLPAVFCILAALLLGSTSGASVGIISYIVSDLILGFGPWTLVNAIFMGIIGVGVGNLKNRISNKYQLFIFIMILLFVNDVMTSSILYLFLGFNFIEAFTISLLGLFLPTLGGFMFAIGPITEISSSLLVIMTRPLIEKALNEVI